MAAMKKCSTCGKSITAMAKCKGCGKGQRSCTC